MKCLTSRVSDGFNDLMKRMGSLRSDVQSVDSDGKVVVLLGPTGVGKSTIVACLRNRKLSVVQEGGEHVLTDPDGLIHDGGLSGTSSVGRYGQYIDTPGWYHVGGSQYSEIANTVMVRMIGDETRIQDIKILLVMDVMTTSVAQKFNAMKHYLAALERQFQCIKGTF